MSFVFVSSCSRPLLLLEMLFFVQVELDIDVRAILYDTKQSFYKCTFSNGECTFNEMCLVGNSIVLTSPAPRQVCIHKETHPQNLYITCSILITSELREHQLKKNGVSGSHINLDGLLM